MLKKVIIYLLGGPVFVDTQIKAMQRIRNRKTYVVTSYRRVVKYSRWGVPIPWLIKDSFVYQVTSSVNDIKKKGRFCKPEWEDEAYPVTVDEIINYAKCIK